MRFEVLNGQESILPLHSGRMQRSRWFTVGCWWWRTVAFGCMAPYRFKDPASEIITILLLNGIRGSGPDGTALFHPDRRFFAAGDLFFLAVFKPFHHR